MTSPTILKPIFHSSYTSCNTSPYSDTILVVATTRHSRTNDLTTSKALQWAIK